MADHPRRAFDSLDLLDIVARRPWMVLNHIVEASIHYACIGRRRRMTALGQVQSVSMRAGALHADGSSSARGGRMAAVTAMAARGVALAALAACVASCSLVSLKSPEKPLPTRDFNARILTHDFATRFNTAIEQTADDMAAGTENPEIRLNTLRWKIGAEGASTRAASQILPMVGFLDMWGLTIQMHEFLGDGAGRWLFGAEQPRAVKLAADLEREADDLARGLMAPTEYVSEKQFVDGYASAYPIANLSFARASILDLWAHDRGTKTRLVDSLGTLPEALGQTSDMLRLYGNNFTSPGALARTACRSRVRN